MAKIECKQVDYITKHQDAGIVGATGLFPNHIATLCRSASMVNKISVLAIVEGHQAARSCSTQVHDTVDGIKYVSVGFLQSPCFF
jgi:hypothetical protein